MTGIPSWDSKVQIEQHMKSLDLPLTVLRPNAFMELMARAFGDPERFIGRELQLASEVTTLDQAREVWADVFGKPPGRFPMPVFMFKRIAGFAGQDLPTMWRWLRTNSIPEETAPTKEVHPGALGLREWMERKRAEQSKA